MVGSREYELGKDSSVGTTSSVQRSAVYNIRFVMMSNKNVGVCDDDGRQKGCGRRMKQKQRKIKRAMMGKSAKEGIKRKQLNLLDQEQMICLGLDSDVDGYSAALR